VNFSGTDNCGTGPLSNAESAQGIGLEMTGMMTQWQKDSLFLWMI
jgi:hypothetical protein